MRGLLSNILRWRIINGMNSTGIILFGGTFDPIHFGHLIVGRSVREQAGASSVVFIPSARPPHKTGLSITAVTHRLEMVRLAIEGEDGFAMDDLETRRAGPSYTLETVRAYRAKLGSEIRLFWLIGADSLPELVTWYHASELLDECEIITACRPGFDELNWEPVQAVFSKSQIARLASGVLSTPRIDISSTDIRQRVAEGKSIQYLVPDTVREYIETDRLYRNS